MDENVDLFHFLIVLQNKVFVICTPEGWVTPPKRMKFLKSAKGGWDGMGFTVLPRVSHFYTFF